MDTEALLKQLSLCVEKGKLNKNCTTPPDMKDMDGVSEITSQLLEAGVDPAVIQEEGLVPGMHRIGELYGQGKAFVPHLLLAAKAMEAGMLQLKPYYASGAVKKKGTFILGTVKGDLHDIGKKLVGFAVEGAGWEVIDLGVDVTPDKFVNALKEHPGAVVGMSALLTITMVHMKEVVEAVKNVDSKTRVLVGGAPVNQEYCEQIGADFYSFDPHKAAMYINQAV